MAHFLMIGAGKLAKHLQNYLELCGVPFQSWDRSQDPHLLSAKVAKASHVLLAISDGALESFYRQHLAGHDCKVIHFSGALAPAGMIAAHPLMSFPSELYDLATYQRIHFVVTGASSLQEALPGLMNSFSLLPAEKKPLYHAMCVLGGNFPVILWQKMLAEMQAMGISAAQAEPYLQQVLTNTLRDPARALTGPLARKDAGTVDKNLHALKGDAFQNIYLAFVGAVAPEMIVTIKERL